MLTASGRMRSSPVRGDKKGALWAVPYGYIVPALRTASRVDGVVLGVCSVMRRYGRLGQCIQHSSYGLYAADYTARKTGPRFFTYGEPNVPGHAPGADGGRARGRVWRG